MKKILFSAFILGFVILSDCAPKWVTTSKPAIQTAGNSVYNLTLEPRKEEFNYYSFFRLTVANNSNTPIEIDWNQTFYLFNGKTAKGFIFQGVTAEQIKDGTIPPDTVLPGATLQREIAALRLVSWAPIGDKSVTPTETRYTPGAMPDGENGVLLFVTYKGKPLRQKISVSIQSEKSN